jgi:hypothetical protein
LGQVVQSVIMEDIFQSRKFASKPTKKASS